MLQYARGKSMIHQNHKFPDIKHTSIYPQKTQIYNALQLWDFFQSHRVSQVAGSAPKWRNDFNLFPPERKTAQNLNNWAQISECEGRDLIRSTGLWGTFNYRPWMGEARERIFLFRFLSAQMRPFALFWAGTCVTKQCIIELGKDPFHKADITIDIAALYQWCMCLCTCGFKAICLGGGELNRKD